MKLNSSRPTARIGLALASTMTIGMFATACSDGGSEPESTVSETATETNVSTETAAAGDDKCGKLKDLNWLDENRERLDEMLAELGDCGADPNRDGAPLALFDWDNTVVKNDIGEAQTHYVLLNDLVIQPEDWADVNEYFTEPAKKELNEACGPLAEPGEVLPTSKPEGATCADAIETIIDESETTGGEKAFDGYNARRIQPAYLFTNQLMAGYTEDEIRGHTEKAREQFLDAAEGEKIKVGTKEYTGWIRYYEEIEDLIKQLTAHGFDVRVVTASPEPIGQVWAKGIGIEADKVLGVKSVLDGDKWGYELEQCGDEPSMTYIEGKRCRVNEEILGITGAAAWDVAPEEDRQVFAAGDSDTDVSFVSDATHLRLTLNRNKVELMCNAYFNEDGKWLVNPMFIEPKDQQKEPYACSTEGRIEEDGSKGPLADSKGNPIPDQEDSVYELKK